MLAGSCELLFPYRAVDGPVERVGIIYEQVHGSNTLDGVGLSERLLHDETGGAAVEIISVLLQHVEERPPGLRGLL